MRSKEKKRSLTLVSTRFVSYIFIAVFMFLLLTSGIDYIFLKITQKYVFSNFTKVVLVIIYWIFISFSFTLAIIRYIKKTYDVPIRNLANAANRVSQGDFSVYVPPIHTKDKLDYLDLMIIHFNELVEELGSIETLKTDFFSNVSHEIKTPIAVIKNATEILQNPTLDEESRQEYISIINQSSSRLSNLINNMLKINKLENQNIYPDCEPYDLYNQLCECILKYEYILEEKDIEIELDMDGRLIIEFDESLIELVWSNLLSNAIKFTPNGGRIVVSQYCTENDIVVSISDTGCGMSEETIKRIFDKFYQGDTSHSMEGNGLGLALVKRILEIYDGSISVKSKFEEGTTFTVYLPINTLSEVGGNEYEEKDASLYRI